MRPLSFISKRVSDEEPGVALAIRCGQDGRSDLSMPPPSNSVLSPISSFYAAVLAYRSGWLSNVSLHSSEQK
jgi:hypothetical protein